MNRDTWRRVLWAVGGLAVLFIAAAAFLYLNCGLRGCPDAAGNDLPEPMPCGFAAPEHWTVGETTCAP